MPMPLREFRSDLAELGLELVRNHDREGGRWCMRVIAPLSSARPQEAGFSSLAHALEWWRKYAADFGLRELARSHMLRFLAGAAPATLDDAECWLGWLRTAFYNPDLAPACPFPPDLERALRVLESVSRWPGMSGVKLRESGPGWRQRAIEAWRASQQPNGWCYGPFHDTSRWALRLVGEEAARQLAALPPAQVSGRTRPRL